MDLVEKLRSSAIPEELRAIAQWVCWRVEDRPTKEGLKPTKVPINPRNGTHAATDDRKTWATFDEALGGITRFRDIAGIGFVFTADDHYVGVDVDKCRVDGVVDREAAQWSKHLKSYGEVSWSGTGIHVILKGQLPPKGRRKGRWEMYEERRFFAMTGERCPWCSENVEHRQKELDELHAWVFGRAKETDQVMLGPFFIGPEAEPPKDLFDALMDADPAFARTWAHDRPDHPEWSASEYDLALASRAAMASWTDQQIVDLMIAHRRKHGERIKDHVQYYEHTLRRAREGLRAPHARVETVLGVDPSQVDAATLLDQISSRLGLPEDSKLLKIEEYTGDPPLYRIHTARGVVDVKAINGIISHGDLKQRIAQACKILIRSFRGAQWDPIAQALLNSITVVEVGDDAHPMKRFAVLVEEFLEHNPPHGEKWDAAAVEHQPFHLDGEVHISIRGLAPYLGSRSKEWVRETEIARALKQVGWSYNPKLLSFKFGGRTVNRRTWRRPVES